MVDVTPDPKPERGASQKRARRYRRKVASPKQWAGLRAEKLDQHECRICRNRMATELHHLVPRSLGGDDVADGLVGLCATCHGSVTDRYAPNLAVLAESLTDAEHSYVIGKLGEAGLERLFGVGNGS